MAEASGSGVETSRIRHFVKTERKIYFLAGTCTECHKIPSEDVRMKACSKCHLVWYCGKECQTKHWKYHKEFCKAVASVAREWRGPGSYLLETCKNALEEGMEYEDCIMAISNAVCQKLNRRMDILEIKIIGASKVCEICKDANFAVLTPCRMCHMVFYCSTKHATQDLIRHSKFCPEYFLSLQCYHLMATEGMPLPGAMPFTIPTVSEYKPMSGNMRDYIKDTFHSDIDACLSEWVSYPLSLLYALEHTGLNNGTKKVSEVKELTVLMCDAFNSIIGTMEHCSTWEYMLHLLPKLKKLNIVLCEPDNKSVDSDYCSREVALCTDCKARNCKLNITLINDYRMYKCSTVYKKPSVIYNHHVTNRDETEQYLPFPEPEIPLVLIGSDKDTIDRSFSVMSKLEKVDMLMPLKLNPFRGMRPTKVPMDYMEDGGFLQYVNSYIVGVRRNIQVDGKFANATRVRLTPP